VRRHAARVLGETQDPQAALALSKALDDEDAAVRDQAAEALRRIRPSLATRNRKNPAKGRSTLRYARGDVRVGAPDPASLEKPSPRNAAAA
jgi:HEAT repeat protein